MIESSPILRMDRHSPQPLPEVVFDVLKDIGCPWGRFFIIEGLWPCPGCLLAGRCGTSSRPANSLKHRLGPSGELRSVLSP